MVPPDGRGLNPMLQNPGMIAHPPLLFLGYAGFTVPFAVLIGVLVAGRRDNRWIAEIRRWMLVTWVFLTAGVVLGAWWAYVELGWGGYWAWDPVENASLLPWLTATGALHSIMVQQHRGMFKIWNAILIALTFILCIFGTYLTRSGVIDSVHSFAPSPIGGFFLVFLGVLTVGSGGLILWRLPRLKSEHRLEGMVSREAVFLYGNLLLLVMMLTTLVGTTFPIISRIVGSEAITVGQPFYNRVVAPMGILLVGLMALGPVLASGGTHAGHLARRVALPALLALVATVVVAIAGPRSPWILVCTFIAFLGTFAVIIGFVRAVSARHRSTKEAWPLAAIRLVDRDHRRYGGQIAHLGLMLIVVGVAGSSLFARQQVFRLQPGETATLGRYDITYVGLEQVREANFTAVQATVRASIGDSAVTLHPQTLYFDTGGNEPNTEVAIRSGWRDDLYVTLAGWENAGALAAIEVRVNPLILWIWLGGIVAVIGGSFAILPPLVRRAHHVAESAPEQTAADVPVGTAARVALEEAH
jgi:cytochrome c-type biogenesis protein CcmF